MNIYRGCEHQCIYCDSRSKCYQIEDFNDVEVKINAPLKLKDELKSKRKKGTICFGAMSDPYTFAESQFRLTRSCLKVIAKYKFPIHLLTKSSMVIRDLDIIRKISKVYAAVSFTLTTVDDSLAKKIEPYAPLPSQRLLAMKKCAEMGIYTGAYMMPILPFIEDNEKNILNLISAVKRNGGSYIIPAFGMTLREGQREYYYKELDKQFPGLSRKYRKVFGDKYSCNSKNYRNLQKLFFEECKRLSIDTKIDIYKVRSVLESEQASFL